MSILDKHPAPWGIEELTTSPPIPRAITCGPYIHHVMRIGENAVGRKELQFADEQAKRLILAAPELLAALKRRIEEDRREGFILNTEDLALIARIESGT